MLRRFKSPEGEKLIYASYDRLLTAWDTETRELDIDTPFGSTHVILCGSNANPPLLLFHGVGDNSALMWIYNMKELARHFRVIAVDTIGGPGKSEPNAAYADGSFRRTAWINSLLDALGCDRVHVAGVSNGSYIANRYAARNPDRVGRAVGMAGGVTLSVMRMLLAFMPEALFPNERNTRKLLRKLCAPGGSAAFEQNPEVMLHWGLLLKHFNNRSMSAHRYIPFSRDDLDVLREKSLFLIGKHDRLSHYPKAIEQLERNGLRYKIIDGAGHGINHEQPERIHRELTDFLLK